MKALALAYLLATLLNACLLAPCHAQDIVTPKDSADVIGRFYEQAPSSQVEMLTTSGEVDTVVSAHTGATEPRELSGKKNPWFSWGLSFFLFPGIGQYYNGDNIRGVAFNVIGATALVMYVAGDPGTEDDLSTIGGMLYLWTWVASWAEAPVRSKEINLEQGYSRATWPPPDWRQTAVPSEENGGAIMLPLAGVTIHF